MKNPEFMYPLITGLQGLNTKYKCSKKRFINYIYYSTT